MNMKLNKKFLWLLIFIATSMQALKGMEPIMESIKEDLLGPLLTKFKENPIPRHIMHHSSTIRDAQLSSDGNMMVTSQGSNNKDDKNFAIVWDLTTGKKRYMILHDAMVSSAYFSPENNMIIISLSGGMIMISNLQIGQILLRKNTNPLSPLAVTRFLSFEQELPQLIAPNTAVITFKNNSALVWDEVWKNKALQELRNLNLIQMAVLRRAFEANQRNEYYVLDMNNEDHIEELTALRRISYETRLFLKKNRLCIFIQPQTLLEKLLEKFRKVKLHCW